MSGIIQLPLPIAANTGVTPNIKTMTTTDNLATITAAGYLNQYNLEGYPVATTDILHILYSFNQVTNVGTFGIFTVAIANGVITLTEDTTTSSVTYTSPSVANHIAVFSNTTGNITDDVATAINGGNIQAGLSGTAGTLASFPATASKGSLKIAAVANTGNTITTISNAAMGQASVISIPDPAAATANFAVAPSALVNNNIVKASGTAGLLVDGGIAAANIQNSTNIRAQVVAGLGGAGAGPLTVAAPGVVATSAVVVNVISSTNPVSVQKVTPAAGTFDLLLSADPGASMEICYIAFIAQQ